MYSSHKELPKSHKRCNIIFVVDVSESLQGSCINILNLEMNNIVTELRDLSDCSDDIEIAVSVLSFSNGAQWMYDEPIDIASFRWANLYTCGKSDFAAACNALGCHLSDNALSARGCDFFAPIIFLFMHNNPTDSFEEALNLLQNNTWFQRSIKNAYLIGNRVNRNLLERFTSDSSCVHQGYDPDSLMEAIRFVSVDEQEVSEYGLTSVYEDGR